MATASADLNWEEYRNKAKKQRVKYAYTYESIKEILGLEHELINIWVDPTREIIAFMTRPEGRSNDIPEAQEVPEIMVQCSELYGDIRCVQAKHHTVPHKFRIQDGWEEIPVS